MSDADPILVEVVRNGFVESWHRGAAIGLDAGGRTVVAMGEVDRPFLLRSCAKPLQAVGMLRAGLDLDGPQLAVACASHAGEARHVAAVESILAGAGVDPSALDNTPMPALDPEVAAEQLLGDGPDRLRQNCSGKHAAMLATCVANGWPTDAYLDVDHPLQVALWATVTELAGEAVHGMAVDGCGAPIGAVSLRGLARAFATLASAPPSTPEGRVAAAMRAHPDLVGGERRDVTRAMVALDGLLAKDGAEGSFAAAMPDGRAAAVVVDDGAVRATVPAVVAVLDALGAASPGLADLREQVVIGHGNPVGAVRPAAGLRRQRTG